MFSTCAFPYVSTTLTQGKPQGMVQPGRRWCRVATLMASKKDPIRAKEIGSRIALARREAGGMTQRELGDLLGVTERSIAAYESGQVIPYRYMRKLEELLEKPATWFLYGQDSPTTQADERMERLERKMDLLIALLESSKPKVS